MGWFGPLSGWCSCCECFQRDDSFCFGTEVLFQEWEQTLPSGRTWYAEDCTLKEPGNDPAILTQKHVGPWPWMRAEVTAVDVQDGYKQSILLAVHNSNADCSGYADYTWDGTRWVIADPSDWHCSSSPGEGCTPMEPTTVGTIVGERVTALCGSVISYVEFRIEVKGLKLFYGLYTGTYDTAGGATTESTLKGCEMDLIAVPVPAIMMKACIWPKKEDVRAEEGWFTGEVTAGGAGSRGVVASISKPSGAQAGLKHTNSALTQFTAWRFSEWHPTVFGCKCGFCYCLDENGVEILLPPKLLVTIVTPECADLDGITAELNVYPCTAPLGAYPYFGAAWYGWWQDGILAPHDPPVPAGCINSITLVPYQDYPCCHLVILSCNRSQDGLEFTLNIGGFAFADIPLEFPDGTIMRVTGLFRYDRDGNLLSCPTDELVIDATRYECKPLVIEFPFYQGAVTPQPDIKMVVTEAED